MIFTKEVFSGDKLKKTEWTFYLIDNITFVLDGYSTYEKESTKHRIYNRKKYYDRLRDRDSNIKENEVPIPEHIVLSIREFVNDHLSIQRWSEYKK